MDDSAISGSGATKVEQVEALTDLLTERDKPEREKGDNGTTSHHPKGEDEDSSQSDDDDEPDGWRIGDRKGNAEKAALTALQYDVDRIQLDARGRVPRGAIIPHMDYCDIWALGGRGIPPVLGNSKAAKSVHVMRTVRVAIEDSLKYRKQEYKKHNKQQPYSSLSPPSRSNPRAFGHWKMIQSLEEFLNYCRKQ